MFGHCRDIVIGEARRQAIIDEFLLPAADIMADGNFAGSNYGYIGQHEVLPASDANPERMLVSMYAFHLPVSPGKRPAFRFTISKATDITAEHIQNALLAIDGRSEYEPYLDSDDDDTEVQEVELAEFFDENSSGIKVIEHTSLDIDTKTLEVSRETDLLLFEDAKLAATYQTNRAPFANGEDQDEELDDKIDSYIEYFQTYWDMDDIKTIHFVLRSLGLYLPRS